MIIIQLFLQWYMLLQKEEKNLNASIIFFLICIIFGLKRTLKNVQLRYDSIIFTLICVFMVPFLTCIHHTNIDFEIILLSLWFVPRYDKTNKMSVRPAKTQISLGILPVLSEASLCTQWVANDPSFLHADSEDSDHTGWMPRLIWVFTGRTVTLLVLSCRGSFLLCMQRMKWSVGRMSNVCKFTLDRNHDDPWCFSSKYTLTLNSSPISETLACKKKSDNLRRTTNRQVFKSQRTILSHKPMKRWQHLVFNFTVINTRKHVKTILITNLRVVWP